MHNSIAFWDKIADKYAKKPVRDEDAYEQTLERTLSYLRYSNHMLELGCGTGTTALRLAGGVENITASDVSPNMIRIARNKAESEGVSNVSFICADMFDPSLGDIQYDVVAAFNLLHLLRDPQAAVRHIHGLVKPDGLFISKTPSEPGRGAPLSYRLMRLILPIMQILGRAPFVKFMSQTELTNILENAGFKVIETGNYPVSPPNHFIVARKV